MEESLSPSWAVRIVAVVVVALLVAPIAVIVPISFSGADYLQFPPQSWSLRWYRFYFGDTGWVGATLVSVRVASLTTLLSTAIGTLAAVGLHRLVFAYKKAIYGVAIMPLMVPHIIVAIAMYFMFSQLRLTGTITSLVISHAVITVPLACVITVLTSLSRFDDRLEDAALSLGASRTYAFARVTLPLIAPGIVTGALLAFLTSFDEVVIAIFLANTYNVTLPKKMWDGLWLEITPAIAAAATIVLAVTLAILLFLYFIQIARRDKARAVRP